VNKLLSKIGIFLLISLATGTTACAQGSRSTTSRTTSQLVTHQTVVRGTGEFDAIRAFVARAVSHGGRSYGSADNVSPGNIGDTFQVTLTHGTGTQAAGYTPYSWHPLPPWSPSPGGASPGDTASVSTCSLKTSEQQTWGFTYKQQSDGSFGWVVTSYWTKFVTACKDKTAS
jgi:hypothetical protein